jgi:hypothetical protein
MSNEPFLMKAQGINGQIELHDDRVLIKRRGIIRSFITRLIVGEKDIPLSHIYSVQFKEAGFPTNGYIRIDHSGQTRLRGGVFLAPWDSNTVMFTRFHQADFKAIKEAIEEKMKHPKPSW